MKKTLIAAKNLVSAWNGLRQARPESSDFSSFGFPGLGYEKFAFVFNEWEQSIELLDSKGKWLDSASGDITDTLISRWLNELVNFVTSAQGNGPQWLLQSQPQFLDRFASVSVLIIGIIEKRGSAAKLLAKDFEKTGLNELASILELAPQIRELADKRDELDKAAERIVEAADESEASYQELSATLKTLKQLATETEVAHKGITSSHLESGSLLTEIEKFRTVAETTTEELENKVVELEKSVAEANSHAKQAVSRLDRVLVDARKQGLAGAFTERGKKVFWERAGWGAAFVAAIAVLVFLSIQFAIDIKEPTYENLLVTLLRKLALAAPLVWIGWYSAKQLGRLGRIQEDYEYKAATALAFQSYKSEVEALGSKELTEALLQKAIGTFGDNPVRLYEQAAKDTAAPIEDLLKRIDADGFFKLLKKVQEFSKPSEK